LKVLFVSSVASSFEVSPIIKEQSQSLKNNEIEIDFYSIRNKGFKGYLSSVLPLKKAIKTKNYDLIHAHYGLSAIVATLAGARPLVVSLMGSDVMEKGWQLRLIKILVKKRWPLTIVKSSEMSDIIGSQNIAIVPNGVNVDKFRPINKNDALKQVKLNPFYRYVIFLSNPERKEKNYNLVQKAWENIKNEDLKLIYLANICHDEVPYYINLADVAILSSLWEGSPNTIKEAMSCNIPIVTTEVGDVKWVIGDTEGCYISSYDAEDMAAKIKLALKFENRTNGRQRIIDLGLDSQSIAKKIIALYNQILANKK